MSVCKGVHIANLTAEKHNILCDLRDRVLTIELEAIFCIDFLTKYSDVVFVFSELH